MKRKTWAVAGVLVLFAGTVLGQMHGGSGGGGMSGGSSADGMGQGSAGGMHGSSGMGSSGIGSMDQGGPMMTQTQRRQLMHTTVMQDQKYQASARAMSKVQGDLSRMQSHMSGKSSANGGVPSATNSAPNTDAQQQGGDDSSDALSSDLQDLDQSNDDLASSLSRDQQTVLAGKLKDLEKKTKEMQALAAQLKSEIDNPQADPKVVREQMKKLDKLGKEIAKQQHEVATALGISA